MRTARAAWVALLLFGSGASALVYEIAWFREFRLVFGASTAANAAVLAVFIGGLGAGGAVLGRRADRAPEPLLLYARLEALVAVSAALTPLLLYIARKAYIGLGGAMGLGAAGATVVRLLLTVVVLGAPTFLMGGTLPAAVRSITSSDDVSRRRVGLLYGVNTLGAVVGCLAANFSLLEAFGTRRTLWVACIVNGCVAWYATILGRRDADDTAAKAPTGETPVPGATRDTPVSADDQRIPAWFVLAASASVGFAFFLMEMVWYRMLGPLLGGTVFTFGLILATALFGIGIGAAAYSLVADRLRPTAGAFAITCVAEAALLVVPYALGDRIAMLTVLLRPLGWMHFGGLVVSWAVIAMIVVFPASVVAGAQFPLLISMLGKGSDKVGEQTGLAYAANTCGAIAGALAGGFGLLPALSALGAWSLMAWLLSGIALLAAGLVVRQKGSYAAPAASAVIVVAVAGMLQAEGPSAVWRHSPIGIGRMPSEITASLNAWRAWAVTEKRAVRWEKDGVESTVALQGRMGWAFVVNGKSDGHVRIDAPTQVMLGMLGAALHPGVKRAMVVGLGSGSTAGWLGALPDVERVDVAELEPAMLHVADVSSPVNHAVLANPKVNIILGDAREILLTSRDKYDVIASEPSNPYRAGVASLFTQEYYRAIADRLSDDGLFVQWLQAYSIDARTMRTVYATLGTVFPEIETWELGGNDLALVASRRPVRYDLPRLRERLDKEPLRSALLYTWRTSGIEGFFSHYVARASFARAMANAAGGEINTDDRSVLEFGFARAMKDFQGNSVVDVREVARAREEHQPRLLEKHLDWERILDEWIAFRASEQNEIRINPDMTVPHRVRAYSFVQFLSGRPADMANQWRTQPREAKGITELAALGAAMAETGDDSAKPLIDRLREIAPVEADAVRARLLLRQSKFDQAAEALIAAFTGYRRDPWPWPFLMSHALENAKELGQRYPTSVEPLRRALQEPFACAMLDESREETRLILARQKPMEDSCVQALQPFEPQFPWGLDLLTWRSQCYERVHHAEAARAASELREFLEGQSVAIGEGLVQGSSR